MDSLDHVVNNIEFVLNHNWSDAMQARFGNFSFYEQKAAGVGQELIIGDREKHWLGLKVLGVGKKQNQERFNLLVGLWTSNSLVAKWAVETTVARSGSDSFNLVETAARFENAHAIEENNVVYLNRRM